MTHLAVFIGGLLGAVFTAYNGVDWMEHIVSGLICEATVADVYDVGSSTIAKVNASAMG